MRPPRWTGDVAIITGRYVSNNGTTVMELWARAHTGESVLLRVQGERPWFEITPQGRWDDSRVIDLSQIKEHEDVTEVVGPAEKWTDLGIKPVWKVYVDQPFKVPKLRKEFSGRWTILSGDIPFVNRFFLDGDLSMHVSVDGEIINSEHPVEICLKLTMSDISNCDPFPAPFKIFSFDLETSIAHNTILCAAAVVEDMGSSERTRHTFIGKEEEILRGLTELVRTSDPDIITGYNIDNFDMRRIVDRANLISKKDRSMKIDTMGWGRVSIDEKNRQRDTLFPTRGTARAWNLAGRCVMDAWWQARQALRPQRETLKFVSRLLFPENEEMQKMDIDASKMDEEWEKRPDEVLEYCLRDAELPLDIMHEIQAFRRKEAIASVAKVSLDTSANGTTSQLIDSLVIRLADRSGIGVPLTGSADRKEEQITGGYVHDVEAGLHPWIAILDFKSMYPSIMIGNNICYTTRIDPGSTDQPNKDELIHKSPTGAKFRNSESRRGMVPQLLEDLMSQRDEHKAGLKSAKDNSIRSYHDQMQYAVKILMNSFYGVFASGFYRFTHRDLGSSITAWARHNIKQIIQELDNEGHKVVYSDTDSIFVKSPVDDTENPKEVMIEFGHATANRFSKASAELEFEKGLSVFFSHGAKKRYVGQVVWPNEEMLVRGYETQRTDSFRYLTDGMKEMFRHVLSDNSEEAINLAIEKIQSAKQGQANIRDLIMSKSCKGRWDKSRSEWDFTKDYANPESMVQVRAAKALIAKGLPFTPGMKIAYIVTNARIRPMQIVPWLEEDLPTNYDGQFYAERLATAFGRVTEAFGWSAKELLSGNRQTSLFSF
ncbi:MAG: DNA polymerase domain-containing protein [Candidatus Poseidoniaceae archaeon]|jgi:DNA polymerase I|nr:DNA polymerase domain-containing protein [Candidatus Poseidoniaceae archaeon]